ncbi:Vitamin B12-binding protein [Rubrobacter xylanophilus DSM 9941]|uniref:helical backbone metal receptor n=1 Tax=Rubrobacter xylanophilus TaxID=49319 RepID=UPI001C64291B|nr:helical backbone metal receptor [Rubrobacter xylanophilus]QYJ15500.1 Vitamin B12-binding protein [Rubrobacter xylanophilus DSM 9941]
MVPRRIVSLVPSLTEALFTFGAGERVVGRTRYCTQPPRAVRRVATVGGTKKVDVERVLALGADLVVAVREENRREDVEELRRAGVEVFLGEPRTVAEALGMLWELARRVGTPRADAFLKRTERVIRRLESSLPERPRRVFVPVWENPLMTVGAGTYAHDVLRLCGGENVFEDRMRYPEVSPEEVEARRPEVVLLPDEPYPFSAAELSGYYGLDIPAAYSDSIFLVDGKLLTWYGPRMAGSLAQLAALLRF